MGSTDSLFEDWYEIKQQLKELTSKEEIIKKRIERLMKDSGAGELVGKDYCVTRRQGVRESISKKDVPRDVWDKYHKRTEYIVMTLALKKKGKKKLTHDES